MTEQNRIAFIQASWHEDIVDQCRLAFADEIVKLGHSADRVDYFKVPGSLELPLQAKLLANSDLYAAIVLAGLVVDGGIYRHDFVANAVISGLMQVQLETEVPILSAVLTPHHFHEHEQHRTFFHDHFAVKGREVAHACALTIESVSRLKHSVGHAF